MSIGHETSLVIQSYTTYPTECQIRDAIYSAETNCVELMHAENQYPRHTDRNVTWKPFMTLHEGLLLQYYDWFLVSQHSEQLKNPADECAMPARLWKHGIYDFLELLRHSLPKSREYMDEFFAFAYQMLVRLYKKIQSLKDIWSECLGDLVRYRMGIEEHDGDLCERLREVSMSWYRKASRRNVIVGRLYHHQAILAKAQPLLQLSLYARSLTATQPFNSARESIRTLFLPVLSHLDPPGSNAPSIDNSLLRLMAISFTEQHKSYFPKISAELLQDLDSYITRAMSSFKRVGENMAIIMIASLLMFGNQKSPMMLLFVRKDPSTVKSSQAQQRTSQLIERDYEEHISTAESFKKQLHNEWKLLVSVLVIVLKRQYDQNCLPLIYIIVSFLWAITCAPHGPLYLHEEFPFQLLSDYLNSLLSEKRSGNVESKPTHIELSEDVAMQGLIWAQGNISPGMLVEAENGENDHFERPIISRARKDRILHLSRNIAAKGSESKINKRWLSFDCCSHKFSVEQRYDQGTALQSRSNEQQISITVTEEL